MQHHDFLKDYSTMTNSCKLYKDSCDSKESLTIMCTEVALKLQNFLWNDFSNIRQWPWPVNMIIYQLLSMQFSTLMEFIEANHNRTRVYYLLHITIMHVIMQFIDTVLFYKFKTKTIDLFQFCLQGFPEILSTPKQ